MVRRLKDKVGIRPNWKRSWKKIDLQVSSLILVLFSGIDILQMSFSGLPRHLLEAIPYGQGIALALFGINAVGRLFILKPKGATHAG